MLRVTTGSRLHFGLLSLGADGPRRFGGAGLMVEQPGLCLGAVPAADWSAGGPLAERVLAFARRFAAVVAGECPELPRPPQRFVVERAPPEHVGLGTGTQLGLAVAHVLADAWGLDRPVADLARFVGRGLRSGLGVHGFERGGFLLDGGKRGGEGLAPLLARVAFPEDWRALLVLPGGALGLHDSAEKRAFAELAETGTVAGRVDALCRLILLGLLPALAERDIGAFGEALYEFNRRVGEAFAAAQGGVYAGPVVTALVDWFRRQGVAGVGQSSWGPAVFAVMPDEERSRALVERLRRESGSEWLTIFRTPARNRGAEVSGTDSP